MLLIIVLCYHYFIMHVFNYMIGIIVNKTKQYVNNRRKQLEEERFDEVCNV